MVTVYTTLGSKKEAKKLALLILKNKLGVCVSFFNIESIYFWHKKINQQGEVACLIKTNLAKLKRLTDFIENNHPYEIPIIEIQKPEKINKKYLNWLNKEIE